MKTNDFSGNSYNNALITNRYITLAVSNQDAKQATAVTNIQSSVPSSKVTLSEEAKIALNKSKTSSFEEVGMSARAKLDALKQQASEKYGIPVVALSLKQTGDYSSFSDQELAAMALNSSKNFSDEERTHAEGELAQRVKVSLEPYSNSAQHFDRRGQAMAVNALYEKMSPEVRAALHWTPAMMTANNQMLEGDEKRFGKLNISDILLHLKTASQQGGLTFK